MSLFGLNVNILMINQLKNKGGKQHGKQKKQSISYVQEIHAEAKWQKRGVNNI